MRGKKRKSDPRRPPSWMDGIPLSRINYPEQVRCENQQLHCYDRIPHVHVAVTRWILISSDRASEQMRGRFLLSLGNGSVRERAVSGLKRLPHEGSTDVRRL